MVNKPSVIVSSCYFLFSLCTAYPLLALLQSGQDSPNPTEVSLESADENVSHRTTININQSQSHNIFVNSTPGDELTLSSSVGSTAEIDNSNVNFNKNREQWQRRASSQSHIKVSQALKSNRHSETWVQRQNHTPDLVMDLPLIGNSSPKEVEKKSISVSENLYSDSSEDESVSVQSLESPTGPESPDMTTAAERFAKQNQCTLKKNTKILSESSDSINVTKPFSDLVAISSPMTERKYSTLPDNAGSTTTTFKPQVKVKPPVLKKPVFSVPLPAAPQEVLRKDQPDLT